MSLESLKQEVYEANLQLVEKKLVISTWGNVSGYDPESGLMVIKASGVPYSELKVEHMVPVDMEGNVIDSHYRPSTDTDTHIELYKFFADKGLHGIVHTHSRNATVWAQLGRDLPCYGTTHCDYFFGDIPCTRKMTAEEVNTAYEKYTGKVIVERFKDIDPVSMPAVLVRSHAPFTWGKTPALAVFHAEVLDYVAAMATETWLLSGGSAERAQDDIRIKHYERKFGKNAYYGQE